jgi:hypothetical protein
LDLFFEWLSSLRVIFSANEKKNAHETLFLQGFIKNFVFVCVFVIFYFEYFFKLMCMIEYTYLHIFLLFHKNLLNNWRVFTHVENETGQVSIDMIRNSIIELTPVHLLVSPKEVRNTNRPWVCTVHTD